MVRKLLFLLIAFFLILVSVNSVFADIFANGTSTLTTDVVKTYQPTGATSNQGTSWTSFLFDVSDYNTLSSIVYTSGGELIYPHDSGSTTFTITSGGTGGGSYSYSKANSKQYWFFTSDTIITGSTVTISYTTAIDFPTTTTTGSTYGGTVDAPAVFLTTGSKTVGVGAGGIPSGFYETFVSNSYTFQYNSSYNDTSKLFSVSVIKPATGTSKINLSNNSGVKYTYETVFNNNFFSYINQMCDGLHLDSSTATKSGTITLFTNSGICASTIPIPNPPGTGGSPSGQIYFDYSNATLPSSYGINVSIASANWSSLDSYYMVVRDPTRDDVSGFPINIPTQTYSTGRMWIFNRLGSWNATLVKCSAGDIVCYAGIFEYKTTGRNNFFDSNSPLSVFLDTATISINPVAYAYNITTDSSSYYSGQIIKVTAINPSPNTAYVNMFPQIGGSGAGQNLIIDAPVPAGQTKYFNVTVTEDMFPGTWEVAMYSQTGTFGKVVNALFTVGSPGAGSKVSVRWDTNNFLGRTNNLYYTTNNNASTITVYRTLPGQNYSSLKDSFVTATGGVSTFQAYLLDTVGSWNATIVDNGNSSNRSVANMTVLRGGDFACNQALPDYICWNNASYLKGSPFILNYKASNIPTVASLLVDLTTWQFHVRALIFDPDNILILNKSLISVPPDLSWSVPTSGIYSSKFTTTAKVGKYRAVLMRDGTKDNNYLDGSQLAEGYAVVADNPDVSFGGVTNKGCGDNEVICLMDGWASMFGLGVNATSRLLLATVWTILIAIVGLMLAGYGGAVLLGAVPYVFFASINFFPQWSLLLIAIIVVIKLRWFN